MRLFKLPSRVYITVTAPVMALMNAMEGMKPGIQMIREDKHS